MKPRWLNILLKDLSDKWQIPALIVALVLTGLGVVKLFSSQKKLSTAEYASLCEELLSRGRHFDSAKLGLHLLAERDLEEDQARHLHHLVALALYRGEMSQRTPRPKILMLAQQRLTASAEGRPLTLDELVISAQIAEVLGRYRLAVDHLKMALELDGCDRIALLSSLVRLFPKTGHGLDEEYDAVLDALLAEPHLAGSELAWAAGLKAERLFGQGRFDEAVTLIREVLSRVTEQDERDELEYALAFGEYSKGDIDTAERSLRNILDRLETRGDLEARTTLLLGRLCLQDDRPEEALAFFHDVMTYHPGSEYALAGLVGRAAALARVHRFEASRMAYDQAFALLAKVGHNRLMNREDVVASIASVAGKLADGGNLEEALPFAQLEYDQTAVEDERVRHELLGQIAVWHRQVAEDLSGRLAKVGSPELAAELRERASRHYREAADDFISLSHGRGMADRASADALWEAVTCYDLAGDGSMATSMLELFVASWPADPHLAEALSRLGQLYQGRGEPEKAIEQYQRLIDEYPRTLPALRAMVLTAQCLMTLGPEHYGEAETLLRTMVDDTSNQQQLDPSALEFREALFLLGKLCYFQERYEECAARLEESLQRYPDDRACPEARFLIAQSYRRLAEEHLRQVDRTNDRELKSQLLLNWKTSLVRASELYLDAMRSLDSLADLSDLENTYLKLSYLYYADCLYDLGDYDESVRAYKRVVDHYERDQIALAAYLQIVNAYQRLGRWGKIKAVLEQMKWLIQQLPDEAFTGPGTIFSRQEWRRWIEWNYGSGVLEESRMSTLAQGTETANDF